MDPSFFNFNIVEVGIFIGVISYVYAYWKNGNSSGMKSALEANNQVIIALKEQAGLNATKILELSGDIGVLRGQALEKDKRITILEGLVKVTPEQEAYMKDMQALRDRVLPFIDNSIQSQLENTEILKEIKTFMQKLNEPIVDKGV